MIQKDPKPGISFDQINQAFSGLLFFYPNVSASGSRTLILNMREGFGAVNLPGALAIKYPNASKEWGRHHIDESLVQLLLGHKDIRTTLITTHITENVSEDEWSPLDAL